MIDLNDRTEDVKSNATFDSLMISPDIIRSLTRHGFQRPSPVQARAIPLGLLGMGNNTQSEYFHAFVCLIFIFWIEGCGEFKKTIDK